MGGLTQPKLFITAKDDFYLVVQDTNRMYDLAPEPKKLLLLAGSEHGTDLFQTRAGEELTGAMLDFLDGLSSSAQIVPTPVAPAPANAEDALPPLQVMTTANARDVVLLRTLQIPGFSQSVTSQCSVAFSPDGRLLSGVCYDNTLPIWDVQSGQLLFSLEPSPLHHVAVAFGPDGKRIAAGGFSKRIGLWDIATGEPIRTTSPLPSPIWDLAFSPLGDRLASASLSLDFSQVPGLHLWDFSDGKLLWSYGGEGKASPLVLSVDYDPTGKTIACGTFDSIIIMDAQTGKPIRTLPIPNHVGDLAFSPDGQLLAAGSDDNKIRLWRTADYELLSALEGHAQYVNGVAFGPDGSFLVSGSHDKKVGIWDVHNGQQLKLLEGHDAAVLRVDVNPSGTLIASVSWDGTVRLWGVIE
jgi:WD40 repeat protein